ncbi:MAG: dihydropyrimidinase [Myxococcales bacterium]|nr:dihydropyrimidinase [Myxococcales bacterium]
MGLLVKGGEVVTASARYTADVYAENETITRIDKNIDASQLPPGTEVIDASGKYVFPGFIDPHTHIYLPFMGTYAKDSYTSGSKAAILGGTTTFIDFCIPGKSEQPLAAFETWNKQSEGSSACDYTYHLAVTRYDEEVEAQTREIVGKGVGSFKIFLAYKGAFGIDDGELYNTLKLAKQLGVITTAHCENETLVTEMSQRLFDEGKVEPEWHYHSRPPLVEAEGTNHLMTFAEVHDAHVYVVHLSCEEALANARRAKHRGVNAWVETLIQFLLLDMTYAERDGFEAAKFVMSPPLRDKRNQDVLWAGVKHGLISTVATDHAPFDYGDQKPMGKDDFRKIPNGIPALEERVKLLYSEGVAKGRLDLHRFVDSASTQAAKIFGLFPRKGTIQLGADADLVIWDPKRQTTISQKQQTMNVDYSAFEGWKVTGYPEVVTVRGAVAARDGKFVGTVGRGRFLQREPTHF